jgi:hypothetical protein
MKDDRIEELTEQVKSLSLQVRRLQRALGIPAARDTSTDPPNDFKDDYFVVGDRVRILNEVRKPASWDNRTPWIAAEARQATVTRVRGQQVFLLTSNGVSTWRKKKNLQVDI